jgi:hypothetical protein
MLGDILVKEDATNDGLFQVDRVSEIIRNRKISDLQPSELQSLMTHMD